MTHDDQSPPAAPRTPEEQWSEWYDQHAVWVERVLLGICRNEADAEDLVQQTFLELWQELRQGSTPAQPDHWLRTVAKRKAIDLFRKRRTERESGYACVTPAAAFEHPEAFTVRRRDREDLKAAASELSADDREIFHARVRDEREGTEIGRALGRAPQRISDAWLRIVNTLRRKLGD